MTTRGWNTGWSRYDWAHPIRDVLKEEQEASRLRISDLQQRTREAATEEREAAREKNLLATAEEERLVDVARKDVLGALVIAAELTPAMRTLGKLVVEALTTGGLAGVGGPKKALDLVTRHASLIGKAVDAADRIVKLSRLDRGAPVLSIGMQGGPHGMRADSPEESISYEDALAELEGAGDLLERIKAAGGLDPELALALEQAKAAEQTHEPAPPPDESA